MPNFYDNLNLDECEAYAGHHAPAWVKNMKLLHLAAEAKDAKKVKEYITRLTKLNPESFLLKSLRNNDRSVTMDREKIALIAQVYYSEIYKA
jgi:hypothetical protein